MSERRFPVPLTTEVELMVRRLLAGPEPVPMDELLRIGSPKRTTQHAIAWLLNSARVIEVMGRVRWSGASFKGHGAFVIEPEHAVVRVTDEAGLRAIVRVWPRTDPRTAAKAAEPAPRKSLELVWHADGAA